MARRLATAQLFEFGLERLTFCVHRGVGCFVAEDSRKETPHGFLVRQVRTQYGCRSVIQIGRSHEVDGGIGDRCYALCRPVQSKCDEVLHSLPDRPGKVLGTDDHDDRPTGSASMFVNPNNHRVEPRTGGSLRRIRLRRGGGRGAAQRQMIQEKDDPDQLAAPHGSRPD